MIRTSLSREKSVSPIDFRCVPVCPGVSPVEIHTILGWRFQKLPSVGKTRART